MSSAVPMTMSMTPVVLVPHESEQNQKPSLSITSPSLHAVNVNEEPNIWEQICKEFAKKYEGYNVSNGNIAMGENTEKPSSEQVTIRVKSVEKSLSKVKSNLSDLRLHENELKVPGERVKSAEANEGRDYGMVLGEILAQSNQQNINKIAVDDPRETVHSLADGIDSIEHLKTCTPRDFLENYIYPTLLPAMEAMLRLAKVEKCFERKRTKFNALDFLTEYLYIENPKHRMVRRHKDLWAIPFVIDWLKDHPRQPLPLSLIWTELEAATVIQSHWRGYRVRRDSEVQELRVWQREWREINGSIGQTVDKFWQKKMEDQPSDEITDSGQDHTSESTRLS